MSIERRRRATGFSIIEVLVAMLVLAIGLLGLAALQAQGLRFNHDAYIRTQATHLAYDIIDRMRTNRDNAAAYAVPDPGFVCDPTDATIDMDLSCWYQSLNAALPGGDGLITANVAANFYDVTVRWTDRTPRDFAGTLRAPASQADCDTLPGRFWDAGDNTCKLQQTWTVWP